MANSPDRTSFQLRMNSELVAEVGRISEKRRPSNLEVELGLREDKVPNLSDIASRALFANAMMEKSRAAGNLWFSMPLADDSFIWFSDVDERVDAQCLLLGSGEDVEVELLLPIPIAAVLETASAMAGKTVGELVCRSLVGFIVLDTLIEEHGGFRANPHQ